MLPDGVIINNNNLRPKRHNLVSTAKCLSITERCFTARMVIKTFTDMDSIYFYLLSPFACLCLGYCHCLTLYTLNFWAVSLSIERKQPIAVEHSRQPSVGRSMCLNACPSVCPSDGSVHCGKTADRIWVRFGTVGRMDPGMRQVVGFGDRSTGKGNFGSNLGRPIVTNGDFAAYLCQSACTVGAAVWGGVWGLIEALL